jgi:hypothetical protein
LREGLRDLGYIEGRDVVFTWRSAAGDYDRLPSMSRRAVFASKALAVMLFTGVFAIAAQVAMMSLVVLMWNNRWSEHGLLAWLFAHAVGSLAASVVTAMAITSAAGVLLNCVPRSRVQTASIAFRGAALCGLVLSIPLACRLPSTGALIAGESRLFYVVPPVWFLGVEQVLLGNGTPYFLRLAQIAAAVGVVSVAVALGGYVSLYQRFERVVARSAGGLDQVSSRLRMPHRRHLHSQNVATAAIGSFIRATMARSPLHQAVFVIVAACGAGLVLNSFLSEWSARALPGAPESLRTTAVWAPFAVVFAMNIAVRAALVLPFELRANWIFRITEDEATRAEEMNAVVDTLILLGVVLPLAVLVPVEWAVLGPRAIHCTSIALLWGGVLVELQMAEWRRIPFTCSYEPSRQFVGLTMLIGVTAFGLFTMIGSRLVSYSISHPAGWLALMTILGVALLYLRRRRRWLSRQAAFMFEDVLPNEVEPLKLSEY